MFEVNIFPESERWMVYYFNYFFMFTLNELKNVKLNISDGPYLDEYKMHTCSGNVSETTAVISTVTVCRNCWCPYDHGPFKRQQLHLN